MDTFLPSLNDIEAKIEVLVALTPHWIPLERIGLVVILLTIYHFIYHTLLPFLSFVFMLPPPKVIVKPEEDEELDILPDTKYKKLDPKQFQNHKKVQLYDPSTYQWLGEINVTSKEEVNEIVNKARIAQSEWKNSSFNKRRLLMRTLQRFITENQEICAKVAVRDSGKTLLDAIIGEILVTCEKLAWLTHSGEKYLKPEARSTGRMMIMKKVRVEYIPLGVIGAIVPWNYPFHNLFNPISASLFSGNAIVIKVSEYASWSIKYYKRVIDACLDAVGAPRDLVQFVVGYGDTGDALVRSGVDKVIFVGSPNVGRIVAKSASDNWTPVVLELGGKDPFVVCEDADVTSIVQTACRGVWQNMGQNCAGPERFLVYEGVYDQFCNEVKAVASRLKTGSSLGDVSIDCGAICMGPRQLQNYQDLVDDAVSKGARAIVGGYIPSGRSDNEESRRLSQGCFYPPTVLIDVPENAKIMQEEIFGPIMCVHKVRGNSDSEAVRIANNCNFALSSCAFSGSTARARKVASQLTAGMSAVNDLEGCTYMSQSLPFGGLKQSGYDRFAGPEGLRGLCSIRSVCEDLIPFMRNSIPPPMQYPASGVGHLFAQGLIHFFYSTNWLDNIKGIWMLTIYGGYTPPKAATTIIGETSKNK